MQIDFYHLERTTLDKALPAILEKIVSTGKHAILRTDLSPRAEYFNSLLWTYDPASFIPHGETKDGFSDKQQIYITTKDENPNNADFLVLVDGEVVQDTDMFERVFYFFNGLDETALNKARSEWKKLKDADHTMTYWQQNANGKWEKK